MATIMSPGDRKKIERELMRKPKAELAELAAQQAQQISYVNHAREVSRQATIRERQRREETDLRQLETQRKLVALRAELDEEPVYLPLVRTRVEEAIEETKVEEAVIEFVSRNRLKLNEYGNLTIELAGGELGIWVEEDDDGDRSIGLDLRGLGNVTLSTGG